MVQWNPGATVRHVLGAVTSSSAGHPTLHRLNVLMRVLADRQEDTRE